MDENGGYTVDISELLKDNRIWRTIKNGYPYNKFPELGLTDDEAYFATKQAIYSVFLNTNVYKEYKGTNARGNKVVQAIAKLTDIGLHGTETPKTANLKVNKSGSFVEDGNYYSQTYVVTAGVNIGSYEVKINGFPSGSFVANSSGVSKSSFTGGETFKIMIPKSKLNANISGNISVKSKCETYPIFYR